MSLSPYYTDEAGKPPTRPILRYHGGKWMLAPWIIAHFPNHRIYTETFGGAASVLMQKPRCYAEVYNDLDAEIVNVFRVLRDPTTAQQLQDAIRLTPFARDEFRDSYEPSADPVERARRIVIRSVMGFGSAAANRDHKTGFRANSNRSGTTPARDWTSWPEQVPTFVERLRGVVIENKPAPEIIAQHDTPATLHYVDPPYVFATRSMPRGAVQPFCYRHEMTDADHTALAAVLHDVAGMVVLSGYHSELYDTLYDGWHRTERDALADGAGPRTEVLWFNNAAWNATHGTSSLFAGKAVAS
jgi:DNA adenine methylase